MFGIFPAMLTVFNISFANVPGYRPHGSSGSFLVPIQSISISAEKNY
jgi:hypothetical protein